MGIKRIAVFASGNGSNFEAIIQAIESKELNVICVGVVVDKENAYVIERANLHHIPVFLCLRKHYTSKVEMEEAILKQIKLWETDTIVCAGYMRIIGPTLLNEYKQAIINIHPSLLPKYRGVDALGQALAMGDRRLGITVHYVDEGLDTGKIIKQLEFVVDENETRDMIEEKLHKLEHKFYPAVLKELLEEKQ
jgi:formyltetrahydrofolate-dependent phosphoribosylglycinamide formyltransferase